MATLTLHNIETGQAHSSDPKSLTIPQNGSFSDVAGGEHVSLKSLVTMEETDRSEVKEMLQTVASPQTSSVGDQSNSTVKEGQISDGKDASDNNVARTLASNPQRLHPSRTEPLFDISGAKHPKKQVSYADKVPSNLDKTSMESVSSHVTKSAPPSKATLCPGDSENDVSVNVVSSHLVTGEYSNPHSTHREKPTSIQSLTTRSSAPDNEIFHTHRKLQYAEDLRKKLPKPRRRSQFNDKVTGGLFLELPPDDRRVQDGKDIIYFHNILGDSNTPSDDHIETIMRKSSNINNNHMKPDAVDTIDLEKAFENYISKRTLAPPAKNKRKDVGHFTYSASQRTASQRNNTRYSRRKGRCDMKFNPNTIRGSRSLLSDHSRPRTTRSRSPYSINVGAFPKLSSGTASALNSMAPDKTEVCEKPKVEMSQSKLADSFCTLKEYNWATFKDTSTGPESTVQVPDGSEATFKEVKNSDSTVIKNIDEQKVDVEASLSKNLTCLSRVMTILPDKQDIKNLSDRFQTLKKLHNTRVIEGNSLLSGNDHHLSRQEDKVAVHQGVQLHPKYERNSKNHPSEINVKNMSAFHSSSDKKITAACSRQNFTSTTAKNLVKYTLLNVLSTNASSSQTVMATSRKSTNPYYFRIRKYKGTKISNKQKIAKKDSCCRNEDNLVYEQHRNPENISETSTVTSDSATNQAVQHLLHTIMNEFQNPHSLSSNVMNHTERETRSPMQSKDEEDKRGNPFYVQGEAFHHRTNNIYEDYAATDHKSSRNFSVPISAMSKSTDFAKFYDSIGAAISSLLQTKLLFDKVLVDEMERTNLEAKNKANSERPKYHNCGCAEGPANSLQNDFESRVASGNHACNKKIVTSCGDPDEKVHKSDKKCCRCNGVTQCVTSPNESSDFIVKNQPGSSEDEPSTSKIFMKCHDAARNFESRIQQNSPISSDHHVRRSQHCKCCKAPCPSVSMKECLSTDSRDTTLVSSEVDPGISSIDLKEDYSKLQCSGLCPLHRKQPPVCGKYSDVQVYMQSCDSLTFCHNCNNLKVRREHVPTMDIASGCPLSIRTNESAANRNLKLDRHLYESRSSNQCSSSSADYSQTSSKGSLRSSTVTPYCCPDCEGRDQLGGKQVLPRQYNRTAGTIGSGRMEFNPEYIHVPDRVMYTMARINVFQEGIKTFEVLDKNMGQQDDDKIDIFVTFSSDEMTQMELIKDKSTKQK